MIEELQHGLKEGLGTTRAGPLRQGATIQRIRVSCKMETDGQDSQRNFKNGDFK